MNALQRLAQLAGLEDNYYDIWGNQHEVSPDIQTQILSRMGFAVADEQEIQSSAETQEQQPWLSLLEPVYVLSAEQARCITLTAGGDDQQLLHWHIEEETGLQHSGDLRLSQLDVIDQRDINGSLLQRYSLPLPNYLSQGYHQLLLTLDSDPQQQVSSTLIIAPSRCYEAESACPQQHPWGVAAQLYSLRDTHNWGMGDYASIAPLARAAAGEGAQLLGLNPLHAAFTGHPHHISPYSPTSRSFLNVGYIDVSSVSELAECPPAQQHMRSEGFQQQLQQERLSDTIDYAAVWQCKLPVLKLLHRHFAEHHRNSDTQRGSSYRRFCANGGKALHRQAIFDTLFAHFREKNSNSFGWASWPTEYQRADNEAVTRFASDHSESIDFWRYLQWQAQLQLQAGADATREAGMRLGLYLDLAVGSDGSGADVWADSDSYVSGVSVGAPPDKLSPAGQAWGLSPYNPIALQRNAYRPFIQALRASMQYAGALRIDHVLGLMRQFWVLEGEDATQGVYVRQPLEALLNIVALESQRSQCVVIGETLGTVPEGLEDQLAAKGILSYKVLYFECWPNGYFKRPDTYPTEALVTVSTHDLPPLAGWWQAREIDHMAALGHFHSAEAEQHERQQRAHSRQHLLAAFVDAGTLPHDHGIDPQQTTLDERVLVAAQQFLAQSPSQLMVIPIEDLLGSRDQVNLPGTVDEHPNWRQKTPVDSQQLFKEPIARQQVEAIRHRNA